MLRQDAHGIAEVVGHEVGLAIAVEIANSNISGPRTHRIIGLCRKRAVAVTKQDAHGTAIVVGVHEVGLAIAVEIADGNGAGAAPHRITGLYPEGAIAFTEQDAVAGHEVQVCHRR